MNAECLWFITIPQDVQPNSVPTLFVAGKVLLHGRVKCAFGFPQNVKTTRSMVMNGDEVFVRAGLFGGTSPFGISSGGSEFNPSNTSSDSDILRFSFVLVDKRLA